ncbi:hypothetical protein VMCG_09539 [Cytospora schulzeri]|uniref:Signal recognition particle SRP19 subunit n=1 Tax=Cytospora schulzeri TaxID=448051 RepID=A0A423VM65_9PEZI|nr:hypothetical protein VMCG_09539 [Valsa malicola]
MSHPRIEEVEDSDVEMSDPSEGDIDDFVDSAAAQSHILHPSQIPTVSNGPPTAGGNNHALSPASIPTTADRKAYASFQCLYPVYFDASRTRAEGRRVPRELAVASPLAREIVNACRDLRLQTVFEPDKMHPKDWANPGRVKIQLKGGAKTTNTGGVKNKHQLYILIAQHLRNHPATDRSQALWERLPGVPAPDGNKPYPRPAVPRGWKVGEFVPYYSPAMTGGGVSENLFKDMMKEMQGGGGGGGGDMASLLGGMGDMEHGGLQSNTSRGYLVSATGQKLGSGPGVRHFGCWRMCPFAAQGAAMWASAPSIWRA